METNDTLQKFTQIILRTDLDDSLKLDILTKAIILYTSPNIFNEFIKYVEKVINEKARDEQSEVSESKQEDEQKIEELKDLLASY